MALDPAPSHERNQEHGTIINDISKSSEISHDGALAFDDSKTPAGTACRAGQPEQTGLPFRFIDEFERQNSKKVKTEIRAHVRRKTHLKQRKLNEASKPKPLSSGRRRILQKKVETPQSSPGLHQYPDHQQQASQPLAVTAFQPPTSLESNHPELGTTENLLQMDTESEAYGSLNFPLSRWQFGNSKL